MSRTLGYVVAGLALLWLAYVYAMLIHLAVSSDSGKWFATGLMVAFGFYLWVVGLEAIRGGKR